MIVMQAKIDQQPGHFILDTGAPLMIINEEPQTPSRLASSFKEEITVGETVINDFNWAGNEEKKLDALVLDISHLEQAFQRPLKGMIGFNVLKGYELFFDYEKRIVRRYAGRKNQLHQQSRPLHNIPFQKFAHLPVITLKIGNKKFRFGLDTGACTNMIDQSVLDALDETIVTPLADEEVQGLDQHINRVQAVQLKSVEAKGLVVEDLKFLATDLSELQSDEGIVLDGLLGYSFLSRMKFSISYPKQRIYVWEEVKTENGE
jgi:predicted aspartyl protease